MTHQPAVSIIVPIYNSELFIARCIDSILAQTLKDIELILVNDGSSDGSKNIIDNYAAKDARIIAVHKSNGGVSSARNAGLDIARGVYISFIDSDDWVEQNMLESMHETIILNKVDIVAVGVVMENAHGKPIENKTTGLVSVAFKNPEIGVLINEINFSYSVAKFFRREFVSKSQLRFNTDLSLGEDALFTCDYLTHVNSVALISKPFYHYVKCNNESLSTKYSPGVEQFIQMIWDRLEQLYEKFPELKQLQHRHDNSSRAINSAKMHLHNIYKKECPLASNERRFIASHYTSSLKLHDDLNFYKPSTLRDYLFVFLIKTKSPFVVDTVYSLCKPIFVFMNFVMRIKKS